jgi:hypothetical protein
MAVYKGRHVVIDQFISNETPTVKITYLGNSTGVPQDTEWVKLADVALTEEEKKQLEEQNAPNYFNVINENTIMPTDQAVREAEEERYAKEGPERPMVSPADPSLPVKVVNSPEELKAREEEAKRQADLQEKVDAQKETKARKA